MSAAALDHERSLEVLGAKHEAAVTEMVSNYDKVIDNLTNAKNTLEQKLLAKIKGLYKMHH